MIEITGKSKRCQIKVSHFFTEYYLVSLNETLFRYINTEIIFDKQILVLTDILEMKNIFSMFDADFWRLAHFWWLIKYESNGFKRFIFEIVNAHAFINTNKFYIIKTYNVNSMRHPVISSTGVKLPVSGPFWYKLYQNGVIWLKSKRYYMVEITGKGSVLFYQLDNQKLTCW